MSEAAEETKKKPTVQEISPIAEPLLGGKNLERCLQLLDTLCASPKENSKEGQEPTKKSKRNVLRLGIAEVTKSLRKGQRGIVFLASDIHPVDVVAHVPALCEEKDVVYSYLGSRKTMGLACKTKSPASAVMVVEPADDALGYYKSYKKIAEKLRKSHPYL